jgi:hypothetical protein
LRKCKENKQTQLENHKRTMKNIFLSLMLLACSLQAFNDPKMKSNFGANRVLFRVDMGVYTNGYSLRPTQRIDAPVAANNNSFAHNSYLNIESMLMLNNQGKNADGFNKHRPVFLLGKLNYDANTNTSLVTLSYAHATRCQTNFLFFGKVRGYLSVGVTNRMNGTAMMPADMPYANTGARVGYNVYNKNCALQFETYVFHDQVIVNTTAHRRIGKAVLINAGVENNQPKVGFSTMLGQKCRVSASGRMQGKEQVQGGVSMSLNF